MIRVALVDDHVIVRSGFAQLLEGEENICIAGQYSTAKEALYGLKRDPVDIAVIDISMPDENGLTLLENLKNQGVIFKFIILSIYDSASFVRRAIELGASGYLSKCCAPHELINAINIVNNGGRYLCTDALYNLSNDPKELILNILTKREIELFYLFAQGLDAKTVGIKLNLSHKTVHVHRANILDKLRLNNQMELIQFAIKNQLDG